VAFQLGRERGSCGLQRQGSVRFRHEPEEGGGPDMRARAICGIGDAGPAARDRGRGAARLGCGLLSWAVRGNKGSG